MIVKDMPSDYPTCERCYATLCIETGENDASFVSAHLDIQPTSVQIRGECAATGPARINALNMWFLSSDGRVDSKDLRNHLDWLFDRIGPNKSQLKSLREMGCELRISCYWLSKEGEGGPTFSVSQTKKLAELEIEVWLDVYFLGGPESI
jgi:Domain of unknown function (DUF4279)